MVGAFLKPSSGRRLSPIHSISKQYSIQTLERVYKHYYYIIRGDLMNYVNRKYKDTLFRALFSERKHLLSLYNAVNETNYTNEEDLEINTLENVIYLKMKNDISFLFGFP